MNISYSSTRGDQKKLTPSEAILKGIADDGGLYMPDSIPKIETSLEELSKLSYRELATEILRPFVWDFTEEELRRCIDGAYDEKFDIKEIVRTKQAGGAYFLELFHGPTIAFKDMALSILPYFMVTASKKNRVDNDIVILTATSGDTGKAALEGFKDVEGIQVIVFYPKGGVSRVQELQMVTQTGDNTHVVAIHGNFDDAQTGVKNIFADPAYRQTLSDKGYQFSSANSINIGRLIPQIVYYFAGYFDMVRQGAAKLGDPIQICVPTGNFGNILAAYFAKEMGLPVSRFLCASNENKVLFDFLSSGEYDKNRELILTGSPSIDILISSNLERLIYLFADRDAEAITRYYTALRENGRFSVDSAVKERFQAQFRGVFATEEETAKAIKKVYDESRYLIDTHTAVAYHAFDTLRDTSDVPTLIASTASPYKFANKVASALEERYAGVEDLDLIEVIREYSGQDVPKTVQEVREGRITQDKECDVSDMQSTITDILTNLKQ